MIKSKDAIRVARSLIGTPYSTLDCINLIKKVIRTAPGGVPSYTTAGTNALWKSYDSAPKYKDLTWRQMGIAGEKPGMLAFKIDGENVHHVGIVTDDGTVIHSSSAYGKVVETALDKTWDALAVHRYIEAESIEEDTPMYKAEVNLVSHKSSLNLRNGPSTSDMVIGKLPHGAVVDVLAEANEWAYVRYEGASGYVAAEYLVRIEGEVEEPDEPVQELHEFTTLMSSDGTTIVLKGGWKVAED